MKHFNKALVAASLAALTTFTSCVDNEVSPEVKQLREAQVAYVSASANLEAANAAAKEIANAYNEANYAIMLQNSEAQLAEQIARVNENVKYYEAELKKEELRLQEETDKMAKYIAEQGIANAEEYLIEYQSAVAVLNNSTNGLYLQVMQKGAELAKEEMYLASVNAPWETIKPVLEGSLAIKNAELTAEKAALVTIEAVAANPESSVEEASKLEGEVAELQNSHDVKTLELAKATAAETAAGKVLTNAQYVISNVDETGYENLQAALVVNAEELEDATEDLADEKAKLASLEADLVKYEAALKPYADAHDVAVAEYEKAEAARVEGLVPYFTAVNTYESVSGIDLRDNFRNTPAKQYDYATQLYNNAKAAYDQAKADYDAANADGTTTDSEKKAWSDAQEEWKAAQDLYNPYKTAYDAYKILSDNADTAENKMDDAADAMDPFAKSVKDTKTAIGDSDSGQVKVVADAEGTLSTENVEKIDLEAKIAALKPAYDAVVGKIEEYKIAKDAATRAKKAISTEIGVIDATILVKKAAITSITTYLTSINSEIQAQKEKIQTTQAEIVVIEKSIADGAIDKAKQEDKVAVLKAELDKISNAIATQEALVVKYKALLDAALAVN